MNTYALYIFLPGLSQNRIEEVAGAINLLDLPVLHKSNDAGTVAQSVVDALGALQSTAKELALVTTAHGSLWKAVAEALVSRLGILPLTVFIDEDDPPGKIITAVRKSLGDNQQ